MTDPETGCVEHARNSEKDSDTRHIQAPGTADIQRVDVQGAYHHGPKTNFFADLTPKSPNGTPVWSRNALVGAYGTLPVFLGDEFSNIPLTFCGAASYSTDRTPIGLCATGGGAPNNIFDFGFSVGASWYSDFYFSAIGGANVQEYDPAPPANVRVTGVPGGWVGRSNPTVKIIATQPGLGLGGFNLTRVTSLDTELPVGASQGLNCYSPYASTLQPCPQSALSSRFDVSSLPDGTSNLRGHAQSVLGADAASASVPIRRSALTASIQTSL